MSDVLCIYISIQLYRLHTCNKKCFLSICGQVGDQVDELISEGTIRILYIFSVNIVNRINNNLSQNVIIFQLILILMFFFSFLLWFVIFSLHEKIFLVPLE